MLILGEKNLIRVAKIRGSYISDSTQAFLDASNDSIAADWVRRGMTTDNIIRENINRAYFSLETKGFFTPDFCRELSEKKGEDWKDFYPDIFALAEATPFLNRLDEKYRPYVLSMKSLFEEFDAQLQEFLRAPTLAVQSAIKNSIQRLSVLGLTVKRVFFEHRLYLNDGKQIKTEVARIFFQQYTNFREFFLYNFNISVHGLVLHNAPFATNVKVVMNTFCNGYTLWNESNLVCFPTDHVLCPRMRIMEAQERKDFYEEQETEGSKQLLQYTSDPISKVFGLTAGDLIEITRDLSFLKMPSDHSIAYRYIING